MFTKENAAISEPKSGNLKTCLRFTKNVLTFYQKHAYVLPKTCLCFLKKERSFSSKRPYVVLKSNIPFI